MNRLREVIEVAADFIEPPQTLRHALLRVAVFLALAVVVIWLGNLTNLKVSFGWMFGYAWGGLTVYSAMRQR